MGWGFRKGGDEAQHYLIQRLAIDLYPIPRLEHPGLDLMTREQKQCAGTDTEHQCLA